MVHQLEDLFNIFLLLAKLIIFFVSINMIQSCVLVNTHTSDPAWLMNKANQAFHDGNFNKSSNLISRGHAISMQKNNENTAIQFLVLLARLEMTEGDYNQSIKLTNRCIKQATTKHYQGLATHCQILLSSNYRLKGNYSKAQHILDSISGDIDQLTDDLLRIEYLLVSGALKQALGYLQDALNDYQTASKLADVVDNKFILARSTNNIAGIYLLTSRYSDALDNYNESLKIRKQINDNVGLASTYGNFCNLYIQLRDLKTALGFCKQGLRLAKKIGLQKRQANILNSQAAIFRQQGKLKKAARLYSESARLSNILEDKSGYARSLSNLGEINYQLKQYTQALEFYKKALSIKQTIDDTYEQAIIWGNIALVYEKSAQYSNALNAYHQALALQNHFENLEDQWRVLSNLSRLYDNQSQPRVAVFYGKQAVNRIQKIRKNLSKFNKQQRAIYLKDKRRAYEDLANVLIDLGRLYEAQQVMDMLKQDEYLDFIQRSSGSDLELAELDLNETERSLFDHYSKISSNLLSLHSEYLQLKENSQAGLVSVDHPRLKTLEKQLSLAKKQFDEFLHQLTDIFKDKTDLDDYEISDSGLKRWKNLKTAIRRIDQEAALIHFLVTENKLRIILTFTDSILAPISYDSEISRTQLNELIHEFRQKLRNKFSDPLPAAQALYKHILKPFRNDLDDRGIKLLIVHMDEAMRYIPLAALHDGEHYIADVFKTVNYTSESESQLASPSVKDWRIAGLGVSHEVLEGFSELSAVEEELNGIIQIEGQIDDTGIFPGNIFINQAFTRNQLQQVLFEEDNPYNVIHIASHYKHAPGSSSASFLLTGTGETLSLEDIKSGDFPMWQVDLFTLSACETALNVGEANGKEIDGLANTLLSNGLKSVMATLWKVADQSTARFMQTFYQARKTNQYDKARVLQSVQQQFLSGEINSQSNLMSDRGSILIGEDTSKNAEPLNDYSHPYFWAPFILMGNFL